MDCSVAKPGQPRRKSFGRRGGLVVWLLCAAALASVGSGCAGGDAEADNLASGDTHVLGVEETKQLLRQLPYRYEFRSVPTPEGADNAVAGRAVGPHKTVLNFGIALGRGHVGVPVPRAGIAESYGYQRGGFIFTTDTFVKGSNGRLEPGPQFKTAAQWREASRMEVKMTDRLCREATGEPCPP